MKFSNRKLVRLVFELAPILLVALQAIGCQRVVSAKKADKIVQDQVINLIFIRKKYLKSISTRPLQPYGCAYTVRRLVQVSREAPGVALEQVTRLAIRHLLKDLQLGCSAFRAKMTGKRPHDMENVCSRFVTIIEVFHSSPPPLN